MAKSLVEEEKREAGWRTNLNIWSFVKRSKRNSEQESDLSKCSFCGENHFLDLALYSGSSVWRKFLVFSPSSEGQKRAIKCEALFPSWTLNASGLVIANPRVAGQSVWAKLSSVWGIKDKQILNPNASGHDCESKHISTTVWAQNTKPAHINHCSQTAL